MDLSFLASRVDPSFFLEDKDGRHVHTYEIPDTDLYAVYILEGKSLVVDVYDSWDEKYGPFYAEFTLSFVNGLKYTLTEYAEKTLRKKEEKDDRSFDRVIALFRDHYSIEPEFPWDDENCIFRSPSSKKWIAGLFIAKRSQLKIGGEEKVFILNLKNDHVSEIVDGCAILPAWHMNHRLWISVVINEASDETLLTLIKESAELVK